jgi:transposase InsO family protein
VHVDLWGLSPVSSLGGRRYNVTFTDDYSRFTHLTLLCTKDETFNAYKAFVAWAETQHGVKIKCLRTDRGGEFLSGKFTAFLCEQGTERHLTMHDTPQHNRVAETLNRHLFEHVHALITQAGLPKTLWGKALHFTVWVKNHMLTCVLGNTTTPYKQLTGRKPSIAGIPEWGQCIWVHNNSSSKLDMCATIA